MEENRTKEIISAEFVFSYDKDITALPLPAEECSARIDEINTKLEKYVNIADKMDYAVAVGSGLLCGALDIYILPTVKTVYPHIKNEKLEQKALQILNQLKKTPTIHAGEPNAMGLFEGILNEFVKKSSTKKFENELRAEDGIIDLNLTYAAGLVFRYLLKWMTATAKRGPAVIDASDLPEIIKKLLYLLSENQTAQTLFEQLQKGKIEFDTSALKSNGVPDNITDFVNRFESKLNKKLFKSTEDFHLKYKSPIPPSFDIHLYITQAVSVLLNEIIVRGFYFIRHVLIELENCNDPDRIDIEKVLPFDNKTITRMMTIATLTYSAADMTDAAVRAALESGGCAPLFAAGFKSRVNTVGVGRAVIAVVKDVSMENEEKELLRQRRELTEIMSAKQVEAILAYRKQMESIVEQYLAEDLQTFLRGTDEIESGLEINDSDKVIHGNVIIQRVLGREPQFTNQQEFDAFMDSEEALVL